MEVDESMNSDSEMIKNSKRPARPTSLAYSNINNTITIEDEKSLGFGAFGIVCSITSAKRAYRELKILSNIYHENVVCMKDIVKMDDRENFQEIMIICEFMQTDLHKIIASKQPLTMDHVKLFLYQILRGIKFIHSCGILHRDLKPGNLLVNGNCLLKICDFGLARTVEESHYPETMTMEVVTQFYRSPELLLGFNRYSSAVDIWSIGCILGELILRRVLFPSMNPIKHLEMITDLIGSPTNLDLADFGDCPRASFEYLSTRPQKQPNHIALAHLSSGSVQQLIKNFPAHNQQPLIHLLLHNSLPPTQPDPDLLALFIGLLAFNTKNRLTADQALESGFLNTARLRFHTWNCECCPRGGRQPENVVPSPRSCAFTPIGSTPGNGTPGSVRAYSGVQLMPTTAVTPMDVGECKQISNGVNGKGSCGSSPSSTPSTMSKASPVPGFPGPGPDDTRGPQTEVSVVHRSHSSSEVTNQSSYNGGHGEFFKMMHYSSCNGSLHSVTVIPEPSYQGPHLDTEVQFDDLDQAR
ncbi:hypothetical protein Ciccas_011116, partial [Cichlidogyrus casuarinus]